VIRRAPLIAAAILLLACEEEGPPPATPVTVQTPPPATTVESAPAPPSAPVIEKLAADSPRLTPQGATFTAPAGWSLKYGSTSRVLEGPEPDLHLAIVDVKAADSPEAAVAQAWPTLDPSFKRPIKVALDRPARHGWEQNKRFIYETSPNERLFVLATALRKGASWTVVLLHASDPSFEKRLAPVRLVADSLRPAGYVRESFKGKTAHALDAARLSTLKDFVDTARQAAGVPGVAVSLFTTDSVLFEGGFGVRELGKTAPVDADTLFIIASNTKGMSTLLLAKLVDEGKFTWDTKVTSVYPTFKLGDADTTGKVLMKHLVCACTGLPRQDLEWLFEFKGSTPKGVLDLLGTMQPTSGFGEVFQYSNVLASAAGFIGGAVVYPKLELGAAYDQAMQSKVFGPLGMTSTTFDFAKAMRGDHASPHAEDFSGKPAVAAMDINRAIVPLRPAGGAWSNVKDVRHYVQMELAKGKLPNGTRYISEDALLTRRAPQVPTGEDETYGMGLEVNTEYGIAYVHHGGSMIGYKSDLFWLPEQGIGGVILANADAGGLLLRPFLRRTLEVLFDGKPEAAEDVASAAAQRKERLAKERVRRVTPADREVVKALAKRYTSPALGDVGVKTDAKGTVFDFGEWKSTVSSRKNDDGTMSLVTIDAGVDDFEFVVNDAGGRRGLILRDAQHEYAFTEKP